MPTPTAPSTQPTPANKQANPGLRGLANLKNTCYINAALQIVAHSPRLRRQVYEDKPPSHPLAQFITAYEQGDDAALKKAHVAATTYVQRLNPKLFVPGKAGSAMEVLEALGAKTTSVRGEANAIYQALGEGKRDIELWTDGPSLYVSFPNLPDPGKLSGFIHGNPHHRTFVRKENKWYCIDDLHVRDVGETALSELPAEAGRKGIILAVYADEEGR